MDNDSDGFNSNDYIGYVEKTIGDIVGSSKNNVYTCELLTISPPNMNINSKKTNKTNKKPTFIINVEEIQDTNITLSMNVRGRNLDKKVKILLK